MRSRLQHRRETDLGDRGLAVRDEIEHELGRTAAERPVVIGQRRGIAMLEDNRLAKIAQARKGKKRFREIDTDDTTLRPARSHRTGKAAGPTAHIEQRAIISKCREIEEPIRQPARAAAEEHLVGCAIGRLIDIRA